MFYLLMLKQPFSIHRAVYPKHCKVLFSHKDNKVYRTHRVIWRANAVLHTQTTSSLLVFIIYYSFGRNF
ncbi:hypothetical protein D0Y50_08455 [Salinimonas sediminis]|uniref:Uncharacterized protein n=1 Tax=Salinimonas sediminis TaxID=2303538 RepID=A0A346NLI6_9ALTE|nr:hypothetical protein D0Y50_08455 [Salinimonas sediminis]